MGYLPHAKYQRSVVPWIGDTPSHWKIDRLKWSTESPVNGVWGVEPDGVDDVACIRVADFDRDNLRVLTENLTLRTIAIGDRRRRVLRRGDLLIEKSGGGEKQLVGVVVEFDHDFWL